MRTVAVTEHAPAPESGRFRLLLVLGLLLAYGGLLGAAFVPSPIGFATLGWLVLGSELAVARWAPFPAWVLSRVQAGAPFRALVAALALLVLGVRGGFEVGALVAVVVGSCWLHGLRFVGSALAEVYGRQRRMPILARGLPLREPIPAAPPRWLTERATEALTWPTLLLVAAGGTGFAAGGDATAPALLLAAGLITIFPLAGVLRLAIGVLAMRRLSRDRWQQAVTRAVGALAPRVVLYHAGGVDTLYQIRAWLPTLERLSDPEDEGIGTPLVVLRDPDAFARLGPTSLPVICVQPSTLMMGLDLPDLRLVFYASHATGNMHMLRRAGVRHAFIGHGDSDKPVTVNPFLRAYTELWVAGPAAAERFRRAESSGLRLDTAEIPQVGRPQLDELVGADGDASADPTAAVGRTDQTITVLYAPTWEGFADEPHQTSVGELGIALLRALLARDDVRVLYRPHPMAGKRDPEVRAAHRQILRLLDEANGAGSGAGADGSVPADHVPVGSLAADSAPTVPPDPLSLASFPAESFGSALETQNERRAWTERRLAEPGHLVVSGPDHDLLACFQAADLLLCDVSSMITEFLITGKPYGVTNPGDRSRDEFEQRCPSIRGGYLIGDTDTIDRLYLAVRSPEENDSSAAPRAELAERLLGPVPAFASFREAARRNAAS